MNIAKITGVYIFKRMNFMIHKLYLSRAVRFFSLIQYVCFPLRLLISTTAYRVQCLSRVIARANLHAQAGLLDPEFQGYCLVPNNTIIAKIPEAHLRGCFNRRLFKAVE